MDKLSQRSIQARADRANQIPTDNVGARTEKCLEFCKGMCEEPLPIVRYGGLRAFGNAGNIAVGMLARRCRVISNCIQGNG